MRGPLAGLRVVEFAGIGPGPHCAMLLADLGAEVLRIEKPGGTGWTNPAADRGRATLTLDLRAHADLDVAREALSAADVLIEGFRPGVMERLGLGPEEVRAFNPRLIYGRMTGWGQTGPLARAAGHDINYVALAGALAPLGEAGRPPTPPLNLVGDYGGGSLYLAFGIMAALYERARSGEGQVIDAAIVDGAASLLHMFAGFSGAPMFSLERGKNLLGGAAPFYRCYACADGKEISIGPLEEHFYAEFLRLADAPESLRERAPENWEAQGAVLAALFKTKTRAEWCALLEGTDACFAPVLSLAEAAAHPHLQARETYVEIDGITQPAPAPRFSRTPGAITPSRHANDVLRSWGLNRTP